MAEAIIFDLAGVIFNIDGISEEYVRLCKKTNTVGNTPWNDFREEWNKTKIDQISCSEFYKIIANKLKVSESEIESLFLGNVKLNEEIKELILKLKEEYNIGILSNTIKDLVKTYTKLWNFKKIAQVVTSCEDRVKKPDHEAINLIINKLNLKKEDVIFIDDSEKTIDAYSQIGIKCIKYENNNQLIKELNKIGVEA
jgi:putative hydrolase of the HAD superfamily